VLNANDTVRIETLLALSLSTRWPVREVQATDDPVEKPTNAKTNDELSAPLQDLDSSGRRVVKALMQSYEKLSPEDQTLWLTHRLARIRANTQERNRRFDKDIHSSQIIRALRDEPPTVRSIVTRSLPPPYSDIVAQALDLESENAPSDGSDQQHIEPTIADVVRQGFFGRFVATDGLKDVTPLDLLSVVELARLIRLLGVRETAIACQNIPAVETVTAFLKRFSAEDAHAIVSHLSVTKTVDADRIELADLLLRQAISHASDDAAAMLDRVGLTLLAIVLEKRNPLHRRHIVQKLSIQAAEELGQLMSTLPEICDASLKHQVVEEAELLAIKLHHLPAETGEERRGAISLQLVNE
jgi:hypothetical protein